MGMDEFEEDLEEATKKTEKEVNKSGAKLRNGMRFDKI